MPNEIIFYEQYGALGRRIEYVKPAGIFLGHGV
jgi:hypothetical protein